MAQGLEYADRARALLRSACDWERLAGLAYNTALMYASTGRTDEARAAMMEAKGLAKDPKLAAAANAWLESRTPSSSKGSGAASLAAARSASLTPSVRPLPTPATAIPTVSVDDEADARVAGRLGSPPSGGKELRYFTPLAAMAALQCASATGAASTSALASTSTAARSEDAVAVGSLPPAAVSTRSRGSSADAAAGNHHAPSSVLPRMLEYGFENLWHSDMLQRHDRGLVLLDTCEQLMKARIGAWDASAKVLLEGVAPTSSTFAGSGLGVGAALNDPTREDASAGMMSTFRNALSFLATAAVGGSTAAGSGDAAEASSRPLVPTVVTGGYDSITSALCAVRDGSVREARMLLRASDWMRDALQRLSSYRATYTATVNAALARVQIHVRAAAAAAAEVRRAQAALDAARKAEQDAVDRLPATPEASVAMAAAELSKRRRRVVDTTTATETAVTAMQEASQREVEARVARNAEMAAFAEQFQLWDMERQHEIARASASLAQGVSSIASTGAAVSETMLTASSTVDVEADQRTFIHQRRVAIMLDELSKRHRDREKERERARSDSGFSMAGTSTPTASSVAASAAAAAAAASAADAAEAQRVIPKHISAASTLMNTNAYIQTEARLAPTVYRWVHCLLRDVSSEVLHGEPCEHVSAGAAACDTAMSIAPFEVTMLHEPAARNAFLRALSSLRSKQQRVSVHSFQRLARILWWTLDACAVQGDAMGAGTVLILSETYYCVPPAGAVCLDDVMTANASLVRNDSVGNVAAATCDAEAGRIDGTHTPDADAVSPHLEDARPVPAVRKLYVQQLLIRHPIWQRHFWTESFYRAVRAAVTKELDPFVSSNRRLANIFEAQDLSDIYGSSEGAKRALPGSQARDAVASEAPSSMLLASIAASQSDADVQHAYASALFSNLLTLALHLSSFSTWRFACSFPEPVGVCHN
ncbi:MAG: hypothetical protein EOO41_00935, partial [Methanobacteriota archaeon]